MTTNSPPPRPWRVECDESGFTWIEDADGKCVVGDCGTDYANEAGVAALICRLVNAAPQAVMLLEHAWEEEQKP